MRPLRRPGRRAGVGAFILAVVIVAPFSAEGVDVSNHRINFNLGGNRLKIPYYRNLALEDPHPGYTRAVVMIHGVGRNAHSYYDTLVEAAEGSGHAENHSILIAPHFLIEDDIVEHSLDDSVLFWSPGGWTPGNNSLSTAAHPRPASMSSFAAVDSILYRLATRNADMDTIVVAGHSAGGQFVNRYAAGSRMDATLEALGVTVRYVVANPSSYLYMNGERRVWGQAEVEFAVPPPDTLAQWANDWDGCYSYNFYKYGLNGIPTGHYMDVGSSTLIARYERKWIKYLIGENDDDPNGNDLDTYCPAMIQGAHRYQRAVTYKQYLDHFFGSLISCTQTLTEIPGVGHTANGMFTSSCGKFSLFDYGGDNCVPMYSQCAWVEFDYHGTEGGAFHIPYERVSDAVNSLDPGGTVMMKAGTTSETPDIDQLVTLRSWGGTATVGLH